MTMMSDADIDGFLQGRHCNLFKPHIYDRGHAYCDAGRVDEPEPIAEGLWHAVDRVRAECERLHGMYRRRRRLRSALEALMGEMDEDDRFPMPGQSSPATSTVSVRPSATGRRRMRSRAARRPRRTRRAGSCPAKA